MRYFKLPLIVTAVAVVLAIGTGLFMITSIHRAKLSNRQKEERAQKLGGAVGLVTLLVITPFWLVAAGKYGKERRQAREAQVVETGPGE